MKLGDPPKVTLPPPTAYPTTKPPTAYPTTKPSKHPTKYPTTKPTSFPTKYPTKYPTKAPVVTNAPTYERCSAGQKDMDCCDSQNPCNYGQGDCDSDSDCYGSLVCKKESCDWNVPGIYRKVKADCCAHKAVDVDMSGFYNLFATKPPSKQSKPKNVFRF